MAEEYPAYSQRHALSDCVDGTVSRLLQHKVSLEKLMQRMQRIRQAKV